MRTLAALLAALLVVVPSVARSQAGDDAASVELAAARHVLRPYADRPVALDPAFARAGTAPGARTDTLRDRARTARLAERLGARVASSADSGAVHLLLSPVDLRGDSATVDATAARRGASGVRGFYRTVRLHLARGADGWRVAREVELGVS